MTEEHKAALAKGRMEGRVVRDYLEGLRATKTWLLKEATS
jgi:hypothetical protein